MNITYLVATYNRKDKIINLINNFILQKNFFKLIILDNNSSDGTFNAISKIRDKRIKVIKKNENLGLFSFLFLARLVKTEIFTWLSDEDIVNLNNQKYVIDLFLKYKDIDVVLGSVIWGEEWANISFDRRSGIVSEFKKINTFLNFSGLAGHYIRRSSFTKSKLLKKINIQSSYNFWNYYSIGMIALESCKKKLYISKKILSIQGCFAKTTNHFVANQQRLQLSVPHYYPKSIIDRFFSKINWINEQKFYLFFKSLLKSEMFFVLYLQLKTAVRKELHNVIRSCYGDNIFKEYEIAVIKFEKNFYSAIYEIFKNNFNLIEKIFIIIIFIKNTIKYNIKYTIKFLLKKFI